VKCSGCHVLPSAVITCIGKSPYHHLFGTPYDTTLKSKMCLRRYPPVRRWVSRKRCSIPFGGSVLLGDSCLPGENRAYARETRIRVALGCCGSALAKRAFLCIREFHLHHLGRSPVKSKEIKNSSRLKVMLDQTASSNLRLRVVSVDDELRRRSKCRSSATYRD
jgi:hypothetical protein